jgi:hypothetical protein
MSVQALHLPRIMEKMTDHTVLQQSEKIAKLDATFRKALRLEDKKPRVVVNVGLLSAPVPVKAIEVKESPKELESESANKRCLEYAETGQSVDHSAAHNPEDPHCS